MKLLLKNGRVINYISKNIQKTDILIKDNKILKIEKNINEQDAEIIDCSNLNIIPGMIDLHCHLRQPGFEYKVKELIYAMFFHMQVLLKEKKERKKQILRNYKMLAQ